MMFKILILQAWYNLSDEALRRTDSPGFNVPPVYWFEYQ